MAYTLNAGPIQSLTLKMPRRGLWTCRAKLASDKVLAPGAAAVIQLGDLTLTGTVRLGGVFASSAEYVIVGGKDGWARPVAERSYRSDAGIKLSKVAVDLGTDAGERVVLLPGADRTLGYAWSRAAGTASAALDAMGSPWWLAPNGTTYVGERVEFDLPKTVKWSLESFDPALRMAMLGVSNDALASFQPGVRLASNGMSIVAGSVTVTVTDRRSIIEVWGV